MRVHEVQRGESLEYIAAKYGVTQAELESHNMCLDKYFYVGQKLNVPVKIQPKVEVSSSTSRSYSSAWDERAAKRQRRRERWGNFLGGLLSVAAVGFVASTQPRMYQSPSPSPSYRSGSGNLDYLLDPNYTIMQVQQKEQQEFMMAKRFRPDLTIEEFRMEKARAYQAAKEAEREISSSSSRSSSSRTSSSSSGHSFCSYCANSRKCPQCGGDRRRTDNFYGTGKSATDRCGVCGGSGRCPYCK